MQMNEPELDKSNKMTYEPCHEIMALVVLRKLILQTRMRSHPEGLDVSFLVGLFVYFHTSSVQTAKVLARLSRYSIGSMSAWHASGPEFEPHVRHILSRRPGHEKKNAAILPLPLIQKQQVSVTSERMWTKYW